MVDYGPLPLVPTQRMTSDRGQRKPRILGRNLYAGAVHRDGWRYGYLHIGGNSPGASRSISTPA